MITKWSLKPAEAAAAAAAPDATCQSACTRAAPVPNLTRQQHTVRTCSAYLAVSDERRSLTVGSFILANLSVSMFAGDPVGGGEGGGWGGVLSCRSSGLALFFSPHPPPRKRAFLKDNWRVCCRRRRVMEICLMRDCGAWRMREREDRERRESVRKRRTWFKDMNFLNKDRGKNNLILSCRSQYNIFCLCEIFKNVPSRILIKSRITPFLICSLRNILISLLPHCFIFRIYHHVIVVWRHLQAAAVSCEVWVWPLGATERHIFI